MKSIPFACGNERFLAVLMWVLRRIDRRWRTRLSHYGWAFYLGNVEAARTPEPWINVCVRCGSAQAAAFLKKVGAVPEPIGFWRPYRCPQCGAWNLALED